MAKNILIVYAHEEKTSFNAALLATAIKSLEGQGHHVTVSDLYAMNFNPFARKRDFKEPLKNPDMFQYCVEAECASRQGRLDDDVILEQQKITQADLVIFQFPLYWFQMPAIMKGWMDRVFMPGYCFGPDEMYDLAMHKGKKAILSFTTGGPGGWYTPFSPNGDMNVILWPIQNALRFSGFDILPPQISYGIDFTTETNRKSYIRKWEKRLTTLLEEKPLYFPKMVDYEEDDIENVMGGFHLKEDTIKKQVGLNGCGLTVGQHLDMNVPPHSMTGHLNPSEN